MRTSAGLAAIYVVGFVSTGCSSAAPGSSSMSPAPDSGETEDSGRTDSAATDAVGAMDATGAMDAGDASPADAAYDAHGPDAADSGDGCFDTSYGVYGDCMTTTACTALGNYTSVAGFCPGPSTIECCIQTPDVSNNPPVPMGWELMQQSMVTTAMTNWAVMILDDPTMYPMWSTTMQTFGSQLVMARVEWHPPDFQNNTVHRGVTLYVPI